MNGLNINTGRYLEPTRRSSIMNVTISINGKITTLSDENRWALRQACATEQHSYLKRRDNTRTVHLREQHMQSALFLEKLANQLINHPGRNKS